MVYSELCTHFLPPAHPPVSAALTLPLSLSSIMIHHSHLLYHCNCQILQSLSFVTGSLITLLCTCISGFSFLIH